MTNTQLAHIEPQSEMLDAIRAKDTQELRGELSQRLDLVVENLVYAAMIVRVLEERGEDLSDIRFGMTGYLRKIAYGQVLPEVVTTFAGHPSLRHISELPIPDQKACLRDGTVSIGVWRNGQLDTFRRPILHMDARQVRQVFAADHIRDPVEQVALVRSVEEARPTEATETPPYEVRGKALVVYRPVKLSRRALEAIIRSMK